MMVWEPKSPVPKTQTWLREDWLSQALLGAPVSTTADSQPCPAKTWKLAVRGVPRFLYPLLENLHRHQNLSCKNSEFLVYLFTAN